MIYRRLGSAGIKVSLLSLGSWITYGTQVDVDAAADMLKLAYDNGINFFDNAEVYAKGQSETIMGAAFRKLGLRRASYLVSTKLYWGLNDGPNEKNTLNRKYLLEAMDGSLERLGMNHVDFVFCHRPDSETPIEETVRAMSDIVSAGKAFYWGTSDWSAEQIKDAYSIAHREHLIPPQMEQPQYNMFNRERVEKEYARLYTEIGLGTTIYSPLASGLLTGKYNQGIPQGTRVTLPGYEWLRKHFESEETRRNIEKVKQMMPIADELGCTMAQLALAWCLKNPNVSTVITGASRPGQVQENMQALDVVGKLSDDVMERIEAILGNRPQPEPDFRK